MELGEAVTDGAERELKEEADARPAGPAQLLAVYSIPRHGQVHFFFRAALDEGHVASSTPSPQAGSPSDSETASGSLPKSCHGRGDGTETLETRLFHIADIPWGELAFPITEAALRHHIAHPQQQHIPAGGSSADAALPVVPVDVRTFVPYSATAQASASKQD